MFILALLACAPDPDYTQPEDTAMVVDLISEVSLDGNLLTVHVRELGCVVQGIGFADETPIFGWMLHAEVEDWTSVFTVEPVDDREYEIEVRTEGGPWHKVGRYIP